MTLGVQYTWFKITGRLVGTGGLLNFLKQWGKKTKKGSQVGGAYDPPPPPPTPLPHSQGHAKRIIICN